MTDVVEENTQTLEFVAPSEARLFQFTHGENLSPEEKIRVDTLSSITKGIFAIQAWAKNQAEKTVDYANKGDVAELHNRCNSVNDLWNLLNSSLNEQSKLDGLPKSDDEEALRARDASERHLKAYKRLINGCVREISPQPNLDQKGVETIAIESSDLDEKYEALKKGVHDVGNPISNLQTCFAEELPILQTKDIIASSIISTLQACNASLELLEEKYPKDKINKEEFQNIITAELNEIRINNPHIQITIDLDGFENVVWGKNRLAAIFQNIAQNLIRHGIKSNGNGRIPEIKVKWRTSEKNGHQEFVIEDNGPGFPEPVIKNGFPKGKASDEESPGEKFGMHEEQEIIKKYGGEIIPENRIGEKGEILGSRLIIRLPIPSNQS